MEFIDRVLKCNDCGVDFVFTAGEQLFFHDKRSQALQAVQGEARARRTQGALGDTDNVFGVCRRNHCAVQADAGSAGAVPFVLPEAGAESCVRGQLCSGSLARAYSRAELKSRSPLNPDGNPAARTSVAS